jgi:hypothetical protein
MKMQKSSTDQLADQLVHAVSEIGDDANTIKIYSAVVRAALTVEELEEDATFGVERMLLEIENHAENILKQHEEAFEVARRLRSPVGPIAVVG